MKCLYTDFFIISLTDGLIASDSVIVHHHHQQADTLNVKVNQENLASIYWH